LGRSLVFHALEELKLLQPETVFRLRRAGFRLYWYRESGRSAADPKNRVDIRQLILQTSVANPDGQNTELKLHPFKSFELLWNDKPS
jgi:hypothetical protein